MLKLFSTTTVLILLNFSTKGQLIRPYKCGPVLKESGIQIFDSLNQFLNLKPGTTFAELGASSGYYNGAMAVFLDNVTFYIQDIDESCLNEHNFSRVLKYYSKFRQTPITESNKFHIVIGTEVKTNLPEGAIDILFSNATFHMLEHPDQILQDLRRSLKDDGTLTIRDEFLFDGMIKQCDDKKCRPLVQYMDFMIIMTRNGFKLIDQTDQFGYPAYKFRKI